jgi:hypothetical protein
MGFTLCQFLLEHFTVFVVMPEITAVQSLKEQVQYFIEHLYRASIHCALAGHPTKK